jgi:hypothetical protein
MHHYFFYIISKAALLTMLTGVALAHAGEIAPMNKAELEATQCHVSPMFAPMDALPKARRNYTNHLMRYTESMFSAGGDPIILSGRVLDRNCVPIPNAEVILWQADAKGKVAENAGLPHDFTFSGVAETGNTGHFYFFTTQPGKRHHMPPHINIQVKVPGMHTYQSAFFFRAPTSDDMLMKEFFEETGGKTAQGGSGKGSGKKKSLKPTAAPKKPPSLHRWNHLNAREQSQLLLQPEGSAADGADTSQLYFLDIVLNKAVPFKSY